MTKATSLLELAGALGIEDASTREQIAIAIQSQIEEHGYLFGVHDMPIAKGSLAKCIGRQFEGSGAILVGFLDWGAHPSGEIQSLLTRVRMSEGLQSAVWEEPCEIIDSIDTDYLQCILACALFNYSGIVATTKNGDFIAYADDDDWFGFFSATEEKARTVLDELAKEGFDPIEFERKRKRSFWRFFGRT